MTQYLKEIVVKRDNFTLEHSVNAETGEKRHRFVLGGLKNPFATGKAARIPLTGYVSDLDNAIQSVNTLLHTLVKLHKSGGKLEIQGKLVDITWERPERADTGEGRDGGDLYDDMEDAL